MHQRAILVNTCVNIHSRREHHKGFQQQMVRNHTDQAKSQHAPAQCFLRLCVKYCRIHPMRRVQSPKHCPVSSFIWHCWIFADSHPRSPAGFTRITVNAMTLLQLETNEHLCLQWAETETEKQSATKMPNICYNSQLWGLCLGFVFVSGLLVWHNSNNFNSFFWHFIYQLLNWRIGKKNIRHNNRWWGKWSSKALCG